MNRPELLAPAGSPESLTAAVQCGADAVYLGYGALNARRNAKNFSKEELEEAVRYCRLRGVKVYLTLNTLLTDRELPLAAETAAFASRIGVDAILVQDLGVARLLRDTVPDVDVHASTQMTVCNSDGVRACADLGMQRVVLSRELPAGEIRGICEGSPVEIETFAHGALCMCYSGQCWLSAVLGGRSGNRGLCAQPCRLAFQWPGDKKPSRPLSLKDLSLAGELEELADMGVACLKLEGRMKRAEYVGVITKIYADLLREGRTPTGEEQAQLEAAFSRQGFTQGYYRDKKGPAMFGSRKEGTKDPEELFARIRQEYSRGEHCEVPLYLSVTVQAGEPMTLEAWDGDGYSVRVTGEPPQPARTKPVTEEKLTAQLAKTGGTVYAVQSIEVQIGEGLSVPLSAVNALRREALAALDEARTTPPERRVFPFTPPKKQTGWAGEPDFTLSLRRWEQMSPALLEQAPAMVYLPSGEIADHEKELTDLVKQYPDIRFAVTFPRVCWDREKPALRKELDSAKRAGVTHALLHHIGQLALAGEYGFAPHGDFGLGLCNSLAAEELARLGFVSATASFECRLAQLRDMGKPLDTELIVYGRLPLMLTENCIMKNRGKGCLCEKSPQTLRDRKGEDFPVEQAWGCRNELFNAKTLWLADKAPDWKGLGMRYARLTFLRESASECTRILEAYRTGRGDAPESFTRGLYYRGVE